MNHPDIETLTQFAMDDPLALDAATLVHVADCEQCTHEVAQIQRVVDATLAVGGRRELSTMEAPPERVWQGIEAAVDALEAGGGSAIGQEERTLDQPAEGMTQAEFAQHDADAGWLLGGPPPEDPDRTERADAANARWTTRAWQLVAAVVIGAVVGGGVAWVVSEDDESATGEPRTVASSTLQGVDGHDASGVVDLVQTQSGQELRIDFDPGQTGKGFIQVWLLDAKTQGMIALGVLDQDEGIFAVPRDVDLGAYSEIDVSLEPFDGDPAHSAVSLARGRVPSSPATAIGVRSIG